MQHHNVVNDLLDVPILLIKYSIIAPFPNLPKGYHEKVTLGT